MRFVIHHARSGAILRHGRCPAEDVAVQEVPDGHAILRLSDDHPPIDDTDHRVIDGVIGPRAPAVVSPETSMQQLRRRRDYLLGATDWTQMPDVPMPAATCTAWVTYRQALRDLPAQPLGTPWPISPV